MALPHPLHDQNRQQHHNTRALLHPDLEQQNLLQLAQQISQHYMVDEDTLMPELIQVLDHSPDRIQQLNQRTAELVERVRAQGDAIDSVDQLLQQYSLDT